VELRAGAEEPVFLVFEGSAIIGDSFPVFCFLVFWFSASFSAFREAFCSN
jgi:hypothetical protein